MASLDLAIVLAYLVGTLVLSAWLSRSNGSTEDYFVGNREMPWWALGLSTLATQSSANSFIGIPAFVALVPGGGLTWLQYELAVPLACLVVMIVFVPVFRGLGLVSLYEYFELRFDRPTRLLLSAVFLVSRALATGVALYAAGLVVQVCTGWPLHWSIGLMGLVTIAYDMLGGMRAVVWTDVLQMTVLALGLLVCIAYGWEAAGGWPGLQAHLAPARLVAVDPGHGVGDGSRAPLWGFVVGGLVLYVAYYGVDQTQAQRQLSARSIGQAQRLLAFNALARFPLTLAYAGLGLVLAAAYAQQEALRDAVPAARLDQLVPRFIELFLPEGIRGLLVAAILAAAMSSLDSALNSLSAATMRDFLDRRLGERNRLMAARLTTLGWGLAITVTALHVEGLSRNLVESINQVGAIFYGPLVAAFACGILDRQAHGMAVRAGVAAGVATNLGLAAVWGTGLFWMWWNVTGLVVAAVVCWMLSRLLPMPAARPDDRTKTTSIGLWNRCREARGWVVGLLAYSLVIFGLLVWWTVQRGD